MPGEPGIQKTFEIPGFRLALAIASLAGMTFELFNELKKYHQLNIFSFSPGRFFYTDVTETGAGRSRGPLNTNGQIVQG
jgi:hypothetical protein